MIDRARRPAIAVAIGALLIGRPAYAANDAPRADALFDEAVKLIKAAHFAEACPKLEESKRLANGLGVTLYLAACYEETGKTASAYAQFVEAEKAAHERHDPREKAAREHVNALAPKLTKIVLRVAPASRVDGLVVSADGAPLAEAQWGTEIPVDPGAHEIRATADGRRTWQTSVDASGAGAVMGVDIPQLEDAAAPPTATVPDPQSGAKAGARPDRAPARDGKTQRIAGAAIAGIGVVMLGAGAFFGLRAKSKLDDSNADGHCGADNACDATGLSLRSDGQKAATIATFGFVVGALAVAGGATVFFTARRDSKPDARAAFMIAPSFAPGAGGLVAQGGF